MTNSCKLWDNCFTCPFPDCAIDRTQQLHFVTIGKQAAKMALDGKTFKQIALELGKSEKTIRRYVERHYEHIKQNT